MQQLGRLGLLPPGKEHVQQFPNPSEREAIKQGVEEEIGKQTHQADCAACHGRAKTKLKSGKFIKMNIDIKRQEQWPHVNMLRKYTRKCAFDNMDFDMFIAGETRIILNMADYTEAQGRLKLLCKLSHWLCKCKDWSLVLGLYEGVIESVELGEAHWTDDFGHYETMIPMAVSGGHGECREVEEHRRAKDRKVEVFWCKAYQKNTSSDKSPHMSQIKPDEPPVPVLHICAHCLQKENRREEHPEVECPAKK